MFEPFGFLFWYIWKHSRSMYLAEARSLVCISFNKAFQCTKESRGLDQQWMLEKKDWSSPWVSQLSFYSHLKCLTWIDTVSGNITRHCSVRGSIFEISVNIILEFVQISSQAKGCQLSTAIMKSFDMLNPQKAKEFHLLDSTSREFFPRPRHGDITSFLPAIPLQLIFDPRGMNRERVAWFSC